MEWTKRWLSGGEAVGEGREGGKSKTKNLKALDVKKGCIVKNKKNKNKDFLVVYAGT